jgi:hypothetical protein
MAKHTPGPWRVGKNGLTISGGDCWRVADVFRSVTDDPELGDSINEANARLIAAAPDLLAMVKRALRDVEARCRAQGINVDMNVDVVNYRAAIAKAEGK